MPATQKWLSKFKGRPLPRGVRIRQGTGGSLRLYVRFTDERGKQKDIITPWYATDKNGIDYATARYHELRVGVLRPDTSANASVQAETLMRLRAASAQGTVSDVLKEEFSWYNRERGRPRSRHDNRIWSATAKVLMDFFGPDTSISDLTSNDMTRFLTHRVTTRSAGLRTCSFDTAFRNLQILRSAIKRAQVHKVVAASWVIQWPKRSDYAAQEKRSGQCARFIDEATLKLFLTELGQQCATGAPRGVYGSIIVYLFKMAAATGMRAGELERLRVKDVTPTEIYIQGKTGSPRWFHFHDAGQAYRIAQAAARARGIENDPEALLFGAGNSRELMYAHTQIARRASERLGLRYPIKLRDMRATSARQVYDAKRDIVAAQHWLRHSTVQQTQRYLRIEKAEVLPPSKSYLEP